MEKVKSFDVFARMISDDDQAFKVAPLDNIIGAQWTKAGTKITIGFAGNVCNGIASNAYVGGLILCDRDRFLEVKALMELEVERGSTSK